jgi:galacturan 1,4-alpha-galacturonidase
MPRSATILCAALAAYGTFASPLASRSGQNCTVKPLGPGQDDAPQILKAMGDCNNGGTVVLGTAGDVFNISQRMTWNLQDVGIEWNGILKVGYVRRTH